MTIGRFLAGLADWAGRVFGRVAGARGHQKRDEEGRGQPYQDLLDRLFYEMAGLTEAGWHGLEDRLGRML